MRSLWPSYREVTVDGARARYLCTGSGPPLLLLASPLALGRTYLRAVGALRRSFTVVCVELPGSGGSERLAAPWSVERYAAWTLELIRHLPLAAPIVVGHAGSSAIARELAQLAPDEIGGLVVLDGTSSAQPFGLRAIHHLAWNALRHRGVFAEHVKNACTWDRAPAPPALGVSSLLATRIASVFAT
jgi:pimeloyl-ACP methyl ester carboxylesterase